MRNVTSAFRALLEADARDYILTAHITLKNHTSLTLTNSNLWSGGFSYTDSVSADGNFEIGAAIINSAKLVINNIDGNYTDYNFTDAYAYLTIGLQTGTNNIEEIRIGTYTVDETVYNGSLITLSLVDYMAKFDKPYSGSLQSYPAQLAEIVGEACQRCGVSLRTTTFPNSTYWVQSRPSDGTITYREVVSWAAQIAGGYARCSADGHLEIKRLPLSNLTTVNNRITAGTLNLDNSTATLNAGAHYIKSTYSHNFSVDPIVITGIAVLQKTENTTQSGSGQVKYFAGTEGYAIGIEDNQLVQEVPAASRVSGRTYTSGQAVADSLATFFVGAKFYAGTCSHLSDPSIEAGDIAVVVDQKGTAYPVLVSSVSFKAFGAQNLRSSAEEPARQSAVRFSQAAKSYLETLKIVEKEKSARELALEDLQRTLGEGSGLYTTIETQQDNSKIYYMHNKPLLSESDIVWKMTSEAWGVSTNGNVEENYTYGMTVDGTAILNQLYTVGINADYITSGRLSAGRIKLYGDMEVFSDQNDSTVRGYLGYGEGNVYGPHYSDEKTSGMHMFDSTRQNEMIVTTSGARMSHYKSSYLIVNGTELKYSNSFYVSDGGVTAEAQSGNVVIRASDSINASANYVDVSSLTSINIGTGGYLDSNNHWIPYPVNVSAPVTVNGPLTVVSETLTADVVSAINYRLQDGNTGATSDIQFIPIASMSNDGTAARWGNLLTLHFKDGLYIGFTQA